MSNGENTQVAVVNLFQSGNCAGTGLFINGAIVRTADHLGNESSESLTDLGKMIALSMGLDFQVFRHDVGTGWAWDEVRVNQIEAANLVAPRYQDFTWMSAFYRCPSCFNEWSHVDQLAQAERCHGVGCDGPLVEPYFVGGPNPLNAYDVAARTEALARHQREYRDEAAVGRYNVEVQRLASRTACFTVEAAGIADAEMMALSKAGDHAFSSEASADYEATSVSLSIER